MLQEACPLSSVSEGAMGCCAATIGVAPSPTPPGHTELVACIVGGRRMGTQKVSHLRSQLERIELRIPGCVRNIGAL